MNPTLTDGATRSLLANWQPNWQLTLMAPLLFLLLPLCAGAQETTELTAEEAEYVAWAEELIGRISAQDGEVSLPAANVTLQIPEAYMFLDAQSARVVLEDAWGNPPDESVLGMLMAADSSPLDDDAWGAVFTYVEDGYVSDEDAANIDFNDLLQDMKSDTAAASEAQVAQGYSSVELLGWAAQPYYDQANKKLHWAKEMQFGDMDSKTLNYNIRTLGRKGYLMINFIAGMNQFEMINNNIDTVLAMAEFNEGSTYFDFDPGVDKVAAYGIGALVAGKVLAKTGLIAAAIIFLKKFGVFLVLGAGALIGRVFKKGKSEEDSQQA